MDGKDNKKEKTREVPDIRMYHISWNFLQLGRDMLWWWWLTWKLFLLSICLTTLSTCGLVFDGTVDGNDNKEEKTREVANTRMYHFGRNFLQLGHDMLWWLWLTWKFFLYFHPIWPHLVHVGWWSTAMWTATTTRRRRPGRWLTIGCITLVVIRMWYAVMSGWCWLISKFFILSTCLTTLSSCVLMGDDTEDGKDNYM